MSPSDSEAVLETTFEP